MRGRGVAVESAEQQRPAEARGALFDRGAPVRRRAQRHAQYLLGPDDELGRLRPTAQRGVALQQGLGSALRIRVGRPVTGLDDGHDRARAARVGARAGMAVGDTAIERQRGSDEQHAGPRRAVAPLPGGGGEQRVDGDDLRAQPRAAGEIGRLAQ